MCTSLVKVFWPASSYDMVITFTATFMAIIINSSQIVYHAASTCNSLTAPACYLSPNSSQDYEISAEWQHWEFSAE